MVLNLKSIPLISIVQCLSLHALGEYFVMAASKLARCLAWQVSETLNYPETSL